MPIAKPSGLEPNTNSLFQEVQDKIAAVSGPVVHQRSARRFTSVRRGRPGRTSSTTLYERRRVKQDRAATDYSGPDDKLDSEVRRLTEAAVRDLEKHGATVTEISLPHLNDSVDASTNISLAETRRIAEEAERLVAPAASRRRRWFWNRDD